MKPSTSEVGWKCINATSEKLSTMTNCDHLVQSWEVSTNFEPENIYQFCFPIPMKKWGYSNASEQKKFIKNNSFGWSPFNNGKNKEKKLCVFSSLLRVCSRKKTKQPWEIFHGFGWGRSKNTFWYQISNFVFLFQFVVFECTRGMKETTVCRLFICQFFVISIIWPPPPFTPIQSRSTCTAKPYYFAST